MIVRIRFGPSRRVSHRQGKNGRAARVTASLLGLVAICLGIFGFWRLGEDLGFFGDFVFSTGFLSHWQVWLAAGAAIRYVCWRLTRYSRQIALEMSELAEDEITAEKDSAEKLAAQKLTAEKITARA
jgi:hypothetical protein